LTIGISVAATSAAARIMSAALITFFACHQNEHRRSWHGAPQRQSRKTRSLDVAVACATSDRRRITVCTADNALMTPVDGHERSCCRDAVFHESSQLSLRASACCRPLLVVRRSR
jgi:hypothetical protein